MALTLSGVTISGGVTFTDEAAAAAVRKLWTAGAPNQTGQNDAVYRSSPTQVGTSTTWSQVTPGVYNLWSIKSDGTLWGWGYNNAGVISGTTDIGGYLSSPTQIGASTNWATVAVGNPAGAIKTDGTLWTWGYNGFGVLGQNDRVYRSSPTQVGTATNWSKVATGEYEIMMVKTDGTLWGMGQNQYGNLGLVDAANRSSPTQVGALTNWSSVSYGSRYNGGAIKTDGTLWTWGYNPYGNLGTNDAASRSSPTQVGSDTNWSKLYISEYVSMAVKTNGTLWVWGLASGGRLGNDTTSGNISSPTQLGALTNWSSISIAPTLFGSVTAVKTDGTLWGWGNNSDGRLGLNNKTNYSSPVQIGTGTNWYQTAAGVGAVASITNS